VRLAGDEGARWCMRYYCTASRERSPHHIVAQRRRDSGLRVRGLGSRLQTLTSGDTVAKSRFMKAFDRVDDRRRIEAHRIGGRKTSLARRALDGRTSVSLAQVVGVQRDRDDGGGTQRRRNRFLEGDKLLQGWDLDPRMIVDRGPRRLRAHDVRLRPR
jgi:hypothetical protein